MVKWAACAGAVAAGGIACFDLDTWWFGTWQRATFGSWYVPMAPSTALVFVGLSLAAIGRCLWPARRSARRIGGGVIVAAILVSALVGAGFLLGTDLRWERWLSGTNASVMDMPVGRMSIVTAAMFLVSALSLGVQFPPFVGSRLLRYAGFFLPGLGFLFAVATALAYATATPIFYGLGIVPVAFLAAVAFAGLDFALLLTGSTEVWRRSSDREMESANPAAALRSVWSRVVLAVLAVLGIALTGFLYLQNQQQALRSSIWNQLSTIADLKAGQIANWRHERLDDARFLTRAPDVARDLAQFLAHPEARDRRAAALGWLTLLKSGDRYEVLAFFDPRLNPRLATPEGGLALNPQLRQDLAEAARIRDVVAGDLNSTPSGIRLDIVAPVAGSESPAARSGPDQDAADANLVGLIVLRLDPRRFLFPLLQTWPVPSATAETLLVRRDGDQVVFLNEVRHRSGTALTLRRSINEPVLPAAMAMRNLPGPIEGIDYRGLPVLAAYRAIPGTPWVMVAKVDQAEIYAPLGRQALTGGVIVALLLLAASLSSLVYRRQRHTDFLRQHRDELEAVVRERTAALATENDVRRRAEAQLRFRSEAEHLLQEISARLLAADVEATDAAIEAGLGGLAAFTGADSAYIFAFDATRRRFSQTHLWCGPAVTTRKQDLQNLDTATRPWWMTRLRRGEEVVAPRVAQLPPEAAAEKQIILAQGIRSIVEVPLMFQGSAIGFVGLSSTKEGHLWPMEDTDMLRTLSQVMTSALKRKAAEEELRRHRLHLEELVTQRTVALHESEKRFQVLFEQAQVAIGVVRGGQVLFGNPACLRLFGCERPEEMVGRRLAEFVAPSCRLAIEARLRRRAATEADPEQYETMGIRRDGSEFPMLAAINRIDLADGAATVSFLTDITARKQAEAALKTSEEQYRILAETAATGIFLHRGAQLLYANDQFAEILGYAPGEMAGKSVWDFVDSGERDRLQGYTAARLKGRPAPRQYEARARRKNGEQIWVVITASLINHNGQPAVLGSFVDITERKRAEEALRESEYFLSRSQEVTQLGSYTFDAAAGTWAGTPELDRIFGIDQQFQRDTDGWLDLIVPEQREAMRQHLLQDVFARHGRFEKEYQIVRRNDGQRRWLFGLGELEFDAADRPIRMIGTIQDITERKQAEAALRESEERFRSLVEHAPDAVLVATRAESKTAPRIAYANAAAARLFGVPSPANLIGQGILDRIPPDYRAGVQEHIRELPERKFIGPVEQVYLRSDGALVPVEVAVAYIVYQGVGGAVIFVRDTTERKKAEEKIREQTLLLDTANDAILVCDLLRRVLYWNQSAERLYGWRADEVLEREVPGRLFGEPGAFELTLEIVMRAGDWTGEVRHHTKEYQEITVLSRWSLVRDDQGRPKSVLVINTDVTERKKLEAQLYRAQRLESIGQLASGIAHDLNNILAPLVMVAPLLRTEIKSPETLRLVDILESNTKRGVEVVRQILTFARGVKAGKGMVPLRPLLKEVTNILGETFPKSIAVQSSNPEDLWMVEGDATQLQQVLMNLCVNARDAMPDGGTLTLVAENVVVDELYASMTPGAKPGPYVVWLVADTGTGISPEHLDRIFDPFFTTKEPGKGTGLGLSTVLGIVRNHGGFVKVESKMGKGTQFRVYLPAQAGALLPAEPQPDEAPPAGQGETILVVDDEEGVRVLTKRILEQQGYHVLLASEGSEAVVVYAQHATEIDAVLTDLMMPLMDGATLIRALRQIAPAVKILATTGVTESAQVTTALRLGAKEVLRKPYPPHVLLRRLRVVLDEKDPAP